MARSKRRIRSCSFQAVGRQYCGGAYRKPLGAEHLFEAGIHRFFLDELAAIRVDFGFEHGGAKVRVFVEQAHGRVLHNGFGIGPRAGGYLSYLRFLFRREIRLTAGVI